jgi:hypothetical protein
LSVRTVDEEDQDGDVDRPGTHGGATGKARACVIG